jgi:hypothetical protein
MLCGGCGNRGGKFKCLTVQYRYTDHSLLAGTYQNPKAQSYGISSHRRRGALSNGEIERS